LIQCGRAVKTLFNTQHYFQERCDFPHQKLLKFAHPLGEFTALLQTSTWIYGIEITGRGWVVERKGRWLGERKKREK